MKASSTCLIGIEEAKGRSQATFSVKIGGVKRIGSIERYGVYHNSVLYPDTIQVRQNPCRNGELFGKLNVQALCQLSSTMTSLGQTFSQQLINVRSSPHPPVLSSRPPLLPVL